MAETKRLSKALAGAGVASRRSCEQLIFDGKVRVNGKTILVPQTFVNLDKDRVQVGDRVIRTEEAKVYYILNKPLGYVCSNERCTGTRLVVDLFSNVNARLFSVGRLDRDTSGLLIVTNDGSFANEVIHPSSGVAKEYLVKVDREVNSDHLEAVAAGAEVEGQFIKPLRIKKVRKGTFKVVVGEGKKREVRTLVESVGLRIRELCRIRIGGLALGGLPQGSWREMSPSDKRAIFEGSLAKMG